MSQTGHASAFFFNCVYIFLISPQVFFFSHLDLCTQLRYTISCVQRMDSYICCECIEKSRMWKCVQICMMTLAGATDSNDPSDGSDTWFSFGLKLCKMFGHTHDFLLYAGCEIRYTCVVQGQLRI